MNYFPERPSGATLHTLYKLYDISVGFVAPPPFEAVYYYLFGQFQTVYRNCAGL